MAMRFLSLIFVLACLNGFGQDNLVPNPGFEELRFPPEDISQLYLAPPWKGFATDAGSVPADLYHGDAISEIASIPYNYVGYQFPKTGKGYAGLILYSEEYKHYREYIQVPLTHPLQGGVEYYLEFYVSLAEKRTLAISNIAALISENNPFEYIIARSLNPFLKKREPTKEQIPKDQFTKVKPQIVNPRKNIIRTKLDWVKISGTFEAKGGEKFLTIGNFDKRKRVEREKVPLSPEQQKHINIHEDAYYYIDDVLLIPANAKKVYEKSIFAKKNPEIENPELPFIENQSHNEPIVLQNVYFNSDESVLLPESYTELDHLFNYLHKNEEVNIIVEGHTDNTNTSLYNLNLSEERALAVKNYLVEKGISKDRIGIIGYGETKPIAENSTEEGKKLNRRVAFRIVNTGNER